MERNSIFSLETNQDMMKKMSVIASTGTSLSKASTATWESNSRYPINACSTCNRNSTNISSNRVVVVVIMILFVVVAFGIPWVRS